MGWLSRSTDPESDEKSGSRLKGSRPQQLESLATQDARQGCAIGTAT